MGLTTDQIDILVDSYVVKLYQDFEQEVISDIARRVSKTGRYTETAEIMARNLREQGYNTGEIQAKVMKSLRADRDYKMAVAEETKAYKTEVKKMIADLEEEALKAGDMLIANAGDMAWNDDMQMWSAHDVDLKKDNTLSQLKQAFTKQTKNALLNLTQSGGGIGVGYYGITDAFTHEMDLATIKVASGAFSYNQAVRECVKNLSQHGVNIKYPSGRKYQIDTAARMTLRTATSQLAGRVTEMNLRKTSTPLVYVDAHAGARPEHAQWQGAVYVYDKTKQKDYPNYKDFWTTTDYGSVTGLKGVNCSHNFYPYWEGDAIPDYKEPEPVMINGKEYTYYEATQEQRRQERQIRQSKREYETLKAIKATPEELQRAQAKLSKQVNEYKQFSASAGIRAKTERLPIFTETPKSSKITVRSKEEREKSLISRPTAKVTRVKTSNEEINQIRDVTLKGINFSCEMTYNDKMRRYGYTEMQDHPILGVIVTKCEIGRQREPKTENLIDTILHEELEIRIHSRKTEYYKKIAEGGDGTIHRYINRVIKKYFEAKGFDYGLVKHG